jgi:hypothetical protein
MIAVSQFMATEHETAKAEERQMMNDIKQLDQQEETLRAAGEHGTVQMNRVRHERKVLEERLKVNREKQGDLDHGAGNEKALLDKAKKEGDAHARHISHLKGLQSAKTMERVQRRNAARLGKKLQQDAADQLQTSLWAKTRVGANKLSLARKMRAGAQGAKVAVREADDGPIDAGKMSSVMLQDSGYRRSSSNVNQLKVAVDATALPGAKGEVELHLQNLSESDGSDDGRP